MSDSPHVEIYKSPNSNISWLSCYLTSLPHLVKKKKKYILVGRSHLRTLTQLQNRDGTFIRRCLKSSVLLLPLVYCFSDEFQIKNIVQTILYLNVSDKTENHSVQSVRFSHSVMCNSLLPHELQHSRPPCPSPAPRVYSDSCPLSRWCHPAISSSVVPFSSCPQPLPASGSFPVSQLFAWGSQSIKSFSFSISPSNEHPGQISFRVDWLDLLAVEGTLKSLLQHHSSKASIFWHSAFFTVQLSHLSMTIAKTITLTRWTFVGKVILCFLIYCLGWSSLFFQGASIFQFHGCIHHLQWFWSPPK